MEIIIIIDATVHGEPQHLVQLHRQLEQHPHEPVRVQPLQEGAHQVEHEEHLLLGLDQLDELVPDQLQDAAQLIEAAVVPAGVRHGQQVGEPGLRLEVVNLREVEHLSGGGGVGPLREAGASQGLLQLGVEAGPVSLGQVGEEEPGGVDPVRQLGGADVGVALEDHLDQHLAHRGWLLGQRHQLHAGHVQAVRTFVRKLVEPPVHSGEHVAGGVQRGHEAGHQAMVVLYPRLPAQLLRVGRGAAEVLLRDVRGERPARRPHHLQRVRDARHQLPPQLRAVPQLHLVVVEGVVQVGHGPEEKLHSNPHSDQFSQVSPIMEFVETAKMIQKRFQ